MVFNSPNKIVVDYYVDVGFSLLWGHDNPQDPIFNKGRNGFVVKFSNCPILWVSNLQTNLGIYTFRSGYVSLSCSVRDLLPLKSIINEIIDNFGIDIYKLRFVSSSTIYENNNVNIVLKKIQV